MFGIFKEKYMEELYIIGIWNVIVFLIYGADKLFAKLDAWRISERSLLISALLLGGAGAFLGMRIWRHKTRHKSFRVTVGFSLAVTIAAIVYIKGI